MRHNHYEIVYWLNNQSKLFSRPQVVVAHNLDEKYDIIDKCERCGYYIESVREFDPVPYEDRFYA